MAHDNKLPVSSSDEIERRSRSKNFQIAKEGWLKAAASYPNLSGSDYAVLITISTHLNFTTNTAWPSIKTIAEMTNRSASTVWRSVERLDKLLLLKVKRAPGRNKSNIYQPGYGEMDMEPKTLRRRTRKTANSKEVDCELTGRTYDEE